MNPKISVIIPVYNVEKYLERCLQSVCDQTFKDIEIICINDGSKDNCLNILKSFKQLDTRVIVIDKENEGLSETRNLGIQLAKGEYITFIDSDDWIEKSMLQELYELSVIHETDVTLCLYNRCYEEKQIPKLLEDLDEVTIYDENETRNKLFRRMIGPLNEELCYPENLDSLVTAWGKLYKTQLLKNNHILFKDTREIGTEDLLFNIYVLDKCKKSIILNKALYNYWKGNSNSLTSVYKSELHLQWKKKRLYIKQYLDCLDTSEEFYNALNNRVCLSTLGLGFNEFSASNSKSSLRKVIDYHHILSDDEISSAFKSFKLRNLPLHWRIFYLFNKYRLSFLSYTMIHIINILRKVM